MSTVVGGLTVRALGPETWGAYAELAERHNGVWGGRWCTWFHTVHGEKTFEANSNRELKQRLVAEGRAHAAVVFDGVAVACLFEQAEFTYVRAKGKNHCVMRTKISPAG
ncbi:hypothetical protein [Kribbella antiqua]|nr:hypothetical protein [Kribbella antiqua]